MPIKKPHFFYGYTIVILSYVISVIVGGVYNSFGIFINPMLQDLGWTAATISGAYSVSLLVQSGTAIICGKLTDRFGPRLVMSVCSIMLGVGYLLMSRVSNIPQFYLVYGIVLGIGLSGFWVPLLSIIARWFSRKRGLMLGIVFTGTAAGIFIAPPILNYLITVYQWRQSFTLIGWVSLISVLVMSQFMKRDPSQVGQFPDGESTETYTVDPTSEPGLPVNQALRTRQFWILASIYLCFGLSAWTVMIQIVPHALSLGISSTRSALILSVIGVLSGLGGFGIGIIGDRIGAKRILFLCLLLMLAALLWLLPAKSVWQFFVFAFIFGIPFGGIPVVEVLNVTWLFGLKSSGAVLGMVDVGAIMGAALGPWLGGYIFDVAGSYQVAFYISTAASIVGLLLVLLIQPIVRRDIAQL